MKLRVSSLSSFLALLTMSRATAMSFKSWKKENLSVLEQKKQLSNAEPPKQVSFFCLSCASSSVKSKMTLIHLHFAAFSGGLPIVVPGCHHLHSHPGWDCPGPDELDWVKRACGMAIKLMLELDTTMTPLIPLWISTLDLLTPLFEAQTHSI